MLVLPFPAIDPVAIAIGPFAIRWYALAYIAGLVLGWRCAFALARRSPAGITAQQIDDFLVWVTLGVVLGGRLGYVLFYKPGYYLANPLEIFAVWHGGMSFHGGALGVIFGIVVYCRRHNIPTLSFADVVVTVVPIGLLFGRIANFINGELYGRASDVPWAIVFPHDPLQLPRHPSQLYEAFLEGVVLFSVLSFLFFRTPLRDRPGAISGAFLLGYGLSRIIAEFFREPDAHLGYLFLGVTMGQLLSLPLIAVGLFLLLRRGRQQARA